MSTTDEQVDEQVKVPALAIRSAQDIIGERTAGKAIEEIFNVFHPAPPRTELAEIFTPETAQQFLERVARFSALLSADDGYDQALARLDAAIEQAVGVRDQVLEEIYRQIRPIERSYRQIHLFFENAEVRDNVQRPPVEFYIFNADTAAIRSDTDSTTIEALDEFVQSRNDSFNFRQFICNLVVPGYVSDRVRKRLEDIASAWGMLLIGDLRDEPNFRRLSDQFRTDGGTYEFLKRPEDKAASDVVLAGYVKLRDRHWFEQPEPGSDDADLYAPASMLFAGAMARTDRTPGGGIAQGPVGMIFGKLRGAERARIEPRISQMEMLTMTRQVVTIIRNEDNDLCFVGSRTQAEDPNGVLKFFTSYRVLRYLERRIAVYLRRIAEQRLSRDLVKQEVVAPIEKFLNDEQKERGTIHSYNLTVDMDPDKFMQGILDISLEVMPVGPAETFLLKIDTPEFASAADEGK
jgi:Type VI secretion system, TssC, VipB